MFISSYVVPALFFHEKYSKVVNNKPKHSAMLRDKLPGCSSVPTFPTQNIRQCCETNAGFLSPRAAFSIALEPYATCPKALEPAKITMIPFFMKLSQ
jgi:hypothetical protein